MNARGSTGAGIAPDLAPPLLLSEEALLSPTMKCLRQHRVYKQPAIALTNRRAVPVSAELQHLECAPPGIRWDNLVARGPLDDTQSRVTVMQYLKRCSIRMSLRPLAFRPLPSVMRPSPIAADHA